MIAEPPVYDEKGKLQVKSVELKVVDFGIFGSIAGIRMENINCGSLKYMAPELLCGHMQSTPKIDIWSLGLMLHGMIFGFLPFNSADKSALEKQIKEQELDYQHIKRLRPNSIKNETRRFLCQKLKTLSDDLIDLVDKMLIKDPERRIDMLQIFEHPWMQKYVHEDRFDLEDEEILSKQSSEIDDENSESDPAASESDGSNQIV